MIKNMRDLGGIKTSDGMTVRHGCLIRSGNLHNATSEELDGVSERRFQD
ncbi:MAG: tyrosine-protein phosphatase [Clostridia bacterium]|nr:tyrosine-protein phosphatase [Clostridia bacterium]